jgi:predicted RNA-binding Zn-ribbon protein involved in translation (DUF1610 family)
MEVDEVAQEEDAQADAKTRQCLVCRQQFPSEWAGERICPKCKSTAAWRSGWLGG